MDANKATPHAGLTVWSELRLDLQPTAKGQIVQTRIPEKSAFGRSSRGGRKVLIDYPECKSAEDYTKKRDAKEGGVFLRGEQKFPRSILWRCLGDGATLELRSVDLSTREKAEKAEKANTSLDAPIILQFTFPAPIRQGCVGFADLEHGDTFDAFIFTENKELYSLRIHSTWFMTAEQSESDPEHWCRSCRPGTLAISQVFRLSSATEQELFFSMTDGRVVRLKREKNGNGSEWEESAYSDGQWSSLRGLLPWQGSNKIKHDGQSLDLSTALSVLPSPDGKHLISVTVNHTLKIWDVESGKPVFEKDLLGIDDGENETTKLTLDPGHKHVLSILKSKPSRTFGDDMYYIVTYSPHHGGGFKIWVVRDLELGHDGGVVDLFDESTLQVPDPADNAVWTLADFKVGGREDSKEVSFWLMLRLNRRYKLYHKRFSAVRNIASKWYKDWQQTSITEVAVTAISTSLSSRPVEALALTLDSVDNLPWLTLTDGISALRTCSETEQLVLNSPEVLGGYDQDVAQSIEAEEPQRAILRPTKGVCADLIDIAAQLRSAIPTGPVKDAIRVELWQDSPFPALRRMGILFEKAGLEETYDRPACDVLTTYLDALGPDGLDHAMFSTIVDTLPASRYNGIYRRHTSFGRKALVTGAAEMLRLHKRIVSDLLCLLLVVDGLEKEEYPRAHLDPGKTFQMLVDRLRDTEITLWMVNNSRATEGRKMTILEDVWARVIQFEPYSQTASASLTNSVRDLLAYSAGRGEGLSDGSEAVAPHILCDLLHRGDFTLASSFLRYLPTTAWATYVRARYHLGVGEYTSAAIYFKKAAFKLSRPTGETVETVASKSASLLNQLEAAHFGVGMAGYYTHVLELFSAPSIQAHTQAAAFASLALQHRDAYRHSELSQQKSELLSRLFHASLALGDFDSAFAALVRYTDKALGKAALKELVADMISSNGVSELLGLPFPETTKREVDSLLTERTRNETSSETEVTSAVKILYAWRVKHGDYRGAAACLVEKLQGRRIPGSQKRPRMKAVGSKDAVLGDYLLSINALSLLGHTEGVEDAENEGWLFVEKEGEKGPRNLVRMKDLRREYQEEIDRRERWEKGQFALTADDEDEDGDAIMGT